MSKVTDVGTLGVTTGLIMSWLFRITLSSSVFLSIENRLSILSNVSVYADNNCS